MATSSWDLADKARRTEKSRADFDALMAALGHRPTFSTLDADDVGSRCFVAGCHKGVSLTKLRSWWQRGWIRQTFSSGGRRVWEVV